MTAGTDSISGLAAVAEELVVEDWTPLDIEQEEKEAAARPRKLLSRTTMGSNPSSPGFPLAMPMAVLADWVNTNRAQETRTRGLAEMGHGLVALVAVA